ADDSGTTDDGHYRPGRAVGPRHLLTSAMPLRLALPALAALLAAPAAAQPAVYDGTLDANDPVRPGGQPYDAYPFEVRADQLVTVRMQSPTFDTYLIVRSPSGVETISDDFDGTMISQVDLVAAEPG